MRKSYENRNRDNRKARHDLAAARVRMLIRLAEGRGSFQQDEMIQFFRILYFTFRIENSNEEALQKAMELCEGFQMTIPEKEIEALRKEKRIMRYRNETIVELLHITPEEADAIGIGKNIKEEEKREQNEIFRMDRDIRIVALFLAGYGYATISELLPPEFSASKSTVRTTIKRLTNGDRSVTLDDIDFYANRCYYCGKEVEDTEEDLGKRRLAMFYLKKGRCIFLSGKAGTGKSYFLEEFSRNYAEPVKIKKVAMTGVAAQHIQGRTIHSRDGFDLECRVYRKDEPVTADEVHRLCGIKVVIIDEISTVRVDIFHRMMQIIRRAEEEYGTAIQVVLTGDFRQLPPVATKEDKEILGKDWNLAPDQPPYCFMDKETWESMDFNPIFLTTVKRQDNLEYVEALDDVQKGNIHGLSYFNRRVDESCASDFDAIHLCALNETIDELNASVIAQHVEDESYRKFAFKDPDNWNGEADQIRAEFRIFPAVEAFVGLRVMTIINKGTYYQNGTIGTITAITDSCITMQCLENGKMVEVRRERIQSQNGNHAYIKQFPIVPAIAISVHKSQGCTFDNVVLHPEKCDQPYQLYVACSRTRKITGLRLTRAIDYHDLKTDRYVEEFLGKFER
jgi:DNA replication protein DnaC